MPMEIENDDGVIEIDFNNKSIRGECKKKDLAKQMEKIKELMK